MRTREELAWAGGFFEGEGSISVQYNRPKADPRARTYLSVHVSQKTQEPLDRFVEALGFGFIQKRNSQGMLRVQYQNFEQAQAAIALLWPYLSERRRQQARDAISRLSPFVRRSHV